DCVDWLEEQITDKEKSKVSEKRMRMVNEAVGFICWDASKEVYELFGKSDYADISSVRREIQVSHAADMIRWLIRHASHDTDAVLTNWVPLNDEGLCREVGSYFYQRALTNKDDNLNWLSAMRTCNWTVCKGLGVRYVRNNLTINANSLYAWLIMMPGGKDAIMEEVREICTMLRSGALKANRINPDELEEYMQNWYLIN
ncbi:MAG: hypothetical protein K2O40_03365, partial [Lachnospiraceae bacterium]|nr:hypothetical protein [Lachnospiraceae bacterium]